MPRTAAKTSVSTPKRPRSSLAVAVVGEPSRRTGIAEVLSREGFELINADSPPELQTNTTSRKHALIVMWVEDTGSGLSGCIEPLTQAFPDAPVILVCSSIERW